VTRPAVTSLVTGCKLNRLPLIRLFNADPHGGNFLLHPDGRIGMIDYGATKKLTRNERLTACLLWAALYRSDEDLLWELSILGGYKSKYGRKVSILNCGLRINCYS